MTQDLSHFTVIIVSFFILLYPFQTFADTQKIEYRGFNTFLNCATGETIGAMYSISKDVGHHPRYNKFTTDSRLKTCNQQTSAGSYKTPTGLPNYDRGHLVPANHLDDDPDAVLQSNTMTNITPQISSLNRTGAWRETEKLIECWRDLHPLTIVIGVEYTDPTNDYFTVTHGIRTPDTFYKIVIKTGTQSAVAWRISNSPIKASQLKSTLAQPAKTASYVESIIQESFSIKGLTYLPSEWPALTCDQS